MRKTMLGCPLRILCEKCVHMANRRRFGDSSHHYIDLLLHLRQHGLVRDGDAFEDMMGSVVDRLGGSDEIDMGKTAWRVVRDGWRCDLATKVTDLG